MISGKITTRILAFVLLITLAFLPYCGFDCFAADSLSAAVIYDSQNGEITVSGIAPRGELSVIVAPANTSPDSFSPDLLPTVIKQQRVNGDYSLVLGMPDGAEAGKYNVYVSIAGEDATASFIHMNITAAEEIIPLLSEASGSEFKRLITENALNLGIDTDDEWYALHSDDIISLLDSMKFTDIHDFHSKYNLAYALSRLKSEKDTDGALKKYALSLGIDYEDDFDEDERLTSDAKKELLKLIANADYKAEAKDGSIDFKNIINSLKPVAAVRAETNWIGIKRAVTEVFKDDFAEMLSKDEYYKKIKDKDTVFEKLANSNYKSLEDIKNSFAAATKSVYEKENKTSGGGTSGSPSSGKSGSSGGLGSGISIAPQTESNDEENDKSKFFPDVSVNDWFFAPVKTLAENGVVSGYEDGTFRPQNYITRAEFTKLIMPFGDKIAESENVTFSDVFENDWYFSCVTKAAAKRLVLGAEGKFAPGDYIKREDAALIIYRILSLTDKTPRGYRPFADRLEVSEYARDAVFTLAGAYILNGNEDNKFLPKDYITRAETAQLLYSSFYKQAGGEE